jgi:hypothetical protein
LDLAGRLADAPLGLAPTALLAVLFEPKARREEAWLDAMFRQSRHSRKARNHAALRGISAGSAQRRRGQLIVLTILTRIGRNAPEGGAI